MIPEPRNMIHVLTVSQKWGEKEREDVISVLINHYLDRGTPRVINFHQVASDWVASWQYQELNKDL